VEKHDWAGAMGSRTAVAVPREIRPAALGSAGFERPAAPASQRIPVRLPLCGVAPKFTVRMLAQDGAILSA
jgi:hypothetical protein